MKKYDLKQLRGIGHDLNPVVMVGEKGLNDGVLGEIDRALSDHELIKIKIPAGDSATRLQTAEAIATATKSQIVHRIGRMVLLLRPNLQADEKLSNLRRYGL